MKIVKKNKLQEKRLSIFITAIVLLILSIFLYFNYKNYTLPWKEKNTINTIENENKSKDSQTPETPKSDSKKINDTTVNDTDKNSTRSIVLSAAGQDTKGGPLIVKAILTGYDTTGYCKLTVAKDLIAQSYEADINWTGTYYSCSGFSINLSELSTGRWNLSLTVIQNGEKSTASQYVTLENI